MKAPYAILCGDSRQDAKLSARLADSGATFEHVRQGRMMEAKDAIKEEVLAAR